MITGLLRTRSLQFINIDLNQLKNTTIKQVKLNSMSAPAYHLISSVNIAAQQVDAIVNFYLNTIQGVIQLFPPQLAHKYDHE